MQNVDNLEREVRELMSLEVPGWAQTFIITLQN